MLFLYMKDLKEYILEGIEEDDNYENYDDNFDDFEGVTSPNPLDYNTLKEKINLALVGDIKMYSDDDPDFRDRKNAIGFSFQSKLPLPEINVERIEKTKIFDFYIKHLLEAYKKNIDENIKINVSSENELRHQLATDILLIIKNYKEEVH